MKNSINRIRALVKKEIKDFSKNANVAIICILPLAFIILFKSMNAELGMSKLDILNLGLGMNFTLVTTFAVSMLIAEEKEKNTLRTLMLSSVKPLEFLLGKAIVISLFTITTNIMMYFIVGMEVKYLGHFILWSIIILIIMVLLGGIVGLIAQNQMATGVVGMPVLMLFFFPAMLAPANETLHQIALVFPNYNFQILFQNIVVGLTYRNSYNYILTILGWVIIAVVAFGFTYNKKRLD